MGFFVLLMLMLICMCIAGSTLGFARYFGTIAVSRLQGRSGEVNFKRWKSGVLVVQNVSTGVGNPNSPSQMIQRQVFAAFSRAWLTVLSAQQRADWETYALTMPGKYADAPGVRQIIGSNGGIMSGINALCLTNAWLVSAGLAEIIDPPLAAPAPSPISDLAASSVAGTVTVTWEKVTSEDLSVARIWMASVQGTFHKQIVGLEDSDLETKDITTVKAALGKSILLATLVGQYVYIQADVVNPTGGKSAGSNTYELLLV